MRLTVGDGGGDDGVDERGGKIDEKNKERVEIC